MRGSKYRYPYAYRKRNHSIYKNKIEQRKRSITPFDICIKRDLLNDSEVRAVNFFVSLYKMRYGELFVKSYNLLEEKKGYRGIQSYEWQEMRTSIYFEILRELKYYGLFNNLVNICVFDQFPDFVTNITERPEYSKSYQKLKHALEIISSYMKKNYSHIRQFLI